MTLSAPRFGRIEIQQIFHHPPRRKPIDWHGPKAPVFSHPRGTYLSVKVSHDDPLRDQLSLKYVGEEWGLYLSPFGTLSRLLPMHQSEFKHLPSGGEDQLTLMAKAIEKAELPATEGTPNLQQVKLVKNNLLEAIRAFLRDPDKVAEGRFLISSHFFDNDSPLK